MQQGMQGMPVEDFPNVIPLERIAPTQTVQVDTPDTAPPADAAEQGLTETAAPAAGAAPPAVPKSSAAPDARAQADPPH
jgi:hypothetical protein